VNAWSRFQPSPRHARRPGRAEILPRTQALDLHAAHETWTIRGGRLSRVTTGFMTSSVPSNFTRYSAR